MSEPYTPELGQALFGNPTGAYDTGNLGDACRLLVLRTIETAFWNHNQREWDWHEDPKVPGLTFRPYCWDEDSPEAALPNLQIDGDPVELRWYKRPGRGDTVNVDMTPAMWEAWVDKAMKLARDHQHSTIYRRTEGK